MKIYCSFSEAIREGAKLRPQMIGGGVDEPRGKTCAYVAGVEAIVGSLTGPEFERFNANYVYPYLARVNARCPVADCFSFRSTALQNVVFHLNDYHKWTREQIADWLESEEEKIGYVTITESVEQKSLSPTLLTTGVNG